MGAIEETVREQGVTVFATGVMPKHIHVFAQILPSIDVATVADCWKGASPHVANESRSIAAAELVWPSGNAVLSVSQRGFERVQASVLHLRERHASRELYGILERTDDDPMR